MVPLHRDDSAFMPQIPTLATSLVAYFVASMFMGVYGLTIDTLLLCFCEDKKVSVGFGW